MFVAIRLIQRTIITQTEEKNSRQYHLRDRKDFLYVVSAPCVKMDIVLITEWCFFLYWWKNQTIQNLKHTYTNYVYIIRNS